MMLLTYIKKLQIFLYSFMINDNSFKESFF